MNRNIDHIQPDLPLSALPDPSLTLDDQRDLLAMKGMLRAEAHPVDVEALLSDFHRAHGFDAEPAAETLTADTAAEEDKPTHHRPALTVWLSAAIAVAAAVAAFVLLRPTTVPIPEGTELVYQPSEDNDITATQLTNGNGQTIALKPKESALPQTSKRTATDLMTLDVAMGESYNLTLSDGTEVMLHPGSRLMFPERFTGARREVRLEGEAYFKVAHDARHPFIVHAGDVETTVLGTEFDITARKGEAVSVTLVTGHVRVTSPEGTGNLLPGMRAVIDGAMLSMHHHVDTTPLTMWRDGYYYFDHQNAEEILREIGRAWGKPVAIYEGTAESQSPLRFVANRTDKLADLLAQLSALAGAPITLQEDVIVMGRER